MAKGDDPLCFTLTTSEAESWYCGQDIYPEAAILNDGVIVTFQGQPLGLARKVGSRLKNSYPRERIRDGKLFSAAMSD